MAWTASRSLRRSGELGNWLRVLRAHLAKQLPRPAGRGSFERWARSPARSQVRGRGKAGASSGSEPVNTILGKPEPAVREDFVPAEAYVSRDWLRLEKERLWPKVWQMACREEET